MVALLTISVALSLASVAESLSLRHHHLDVGEANRNRTDASQKVNGECDLGHLPFYLLNLDRRREDKFALMEQVIARDVPWMCKRTCRVSAPDGQKWNELGTHLNSNIMDSKEWQKVTEVLKGTQIYGGKLTPGAVALIVGHGRMWERILQDKAPFAVVMEDDLSRFHPETCYYLGMVTHNPSLQRGWDFIMLQHSAQTIDSNNIAPYPITARGEHVFNTGMYIIKLDAARKALQAMFPISPVQLDSPQSPFWTNLTGAHTIPAVADQDHMITDVQQYKQYHLNTMPASHSCSIRDCKKLDTSRMLIPALADPLAK